MLFLLTKLKRLKRKWYYMKCAANNEVNKKTLCNGSIFGNMDCYPCNKCPYYKYKEKENEDEE